MRYSHEVRDHSSGRGSSFPVDAGQTASDAVHVYDGALSVILLAADFARPGPDAARILDRRRRFAYTHAPWEPDPYEADRVLTAQKMAYWQRTARKLQRAWKAHLFRCALKRQVFRGARRNATLTLGALARSHDGRRMVSMIASYAAEPV